MTNQSNVNRYNSQDLTNTILQDLNTFDFVTSFPRALQLSLNIPNENPNFNRLKTKINCLFGEHGNLITNIKNYFHDEIIIYTLKGALKLPFTQIEIDKTRRLLNRFFIEHEANIKIIFDYVFDDIKPFVLNNHLLSLTSLSPRFNSTVKACAREAVMLFLKSKGAQLITTGLYPTTVGQNLSEQPQSTSNQKNFILILSYIFLLCILFGWKIVFHIISCCIIGLIFVVFYLYISVIYL